MRLLLVPVLLPLSLSAAVIWHVDGRAGRDDFDGRSTSTALRTIQAAVDRVEPGDTVEVQAGVYHESVVINRRGTAEDPIVLRAAEPRSGAVIVTGAVRDIREGKVDWELVDADLALYRVSCAAGWPARVLYGNVDLYPYATLDRLKTFSSNGAPGPRHGYYYDQNAGMLYLRLNPRYAARGLNPADYVIAVAPPTGEGFDGTLVTRPEHYNIGILGHGPAHVVVEGFTFETPGVAGVYIEADDVTVRDCRFYGCRTAVAGDYRERMQDPSAGYAFLNLRENPGALDHCAARVTLDRLLFTQFPAFEDVRDCIARLPAEIPAGREGMPLLFAAMWHRKSESFGLPSEHFKYEIGVACRIGRDWIIEGSAIIDAFEGLSCHAVADSENLVVRGNLFARVCDNAVETEDWSRGMTITGNVILDALEPFSWQPLRGIPWPTGVVFSRNVIANTPALAGMWAAVLPGRGAFKIGVSLSNWRDLPWMAGVPRAPITLGGAGIDISHNLVWFPGGRLFTLLGDIRTAIPEIRIHDNVLAAGRLFTLAKETEMDGGHFTLVRNLVLPTAAGEPGPGGVAAGEGGICAQGPSAAGITAAASLDFRTKQGSPVSNIDVPTPNLGDVLSMDFGDAAPVSILWPLAR